MFRANPESEGNLPFRLVLRGAAIGILASRLTFATAAQADKPIFVNEQYRFFPDRLEAFDVYRGTYRSADGLSITKDGEPDYTWNEARRDKLYLQTRFPILDAVFALAVDETLDMIAPAGTKSTQLDGDRPGGPYYFPYYYWTHGRDIREYTRDSAQHIEWGDSVILDRRTARGTLLRRCDFNRKRLREDAVVTADSVHFIPAAWQYYNITGDREFLEICWDCMWNTMHEKEQTRKQADGLWTGSPWSDGRMGFVSPEHFKQRNTRVKSLYANTIVAGAWEALGQIARVLGKPTEAELSRKNSQLLKTAVNRHLYRPEFGTYCYYKYEPTGQYFDYREDISAGLIHLYGIADERRALAYHEKFKATPYGYRNVDPILPSGGSTGATYHGGNPWENQEAYHGWMLARLRQPDKLKDLIFWHARAGLPLKQWREGTLDPSTGRLHRNYKRLVWGAMGYVSYWTRGVFGIIYEEDGIRFQPCVPNDFGDDFYAVLNNFTYRESQLRIVLVGKGTQVENVLLDGRPVSIVPSELKGPHTIRILMQGHREPDIPAPPSLGTGT